MSKDAFYVPVKFFGLMKMNTQISIKTTGINALEEALKYSRILI